MRSQPRNKASLLSRVSTLAILAAAGSFGAAQQAQADCNAENVLNITTPTTVTGAHACAFSAFVTGDVTNNGTIGPPGDGDYGFFVGKGGISGVLQNNGIITGGGPVYGALTIEANVAGGVRNDGIISSLSGAGVQLGWGTSDVGVSALLEGTITNSGAITSTLGDGVAAILGSTTGGLVNEDDGTISGGNRGVYIAEDFDSWAGGIFNAGQIQGNTAGIQIGDVSPDGGGEGVTFSGGITNDFGGTINSLTGPTVAVGGSSFDGGIHNFGLITQRDEEAAGGENPFAGVGILVTADTFAGGIENTGEIDGLGGPAVWITTGTTTFDGGIQNYGVIGGADDAVRIESSSFSGGLFNDTFAQIVASTGAAVHANAVNWTGDVQNNGLIQGGPEGAGFHFLFGNYTGDFRNAGSIDGGFAGVFIDAVETLQGAAGGEGSTAAEFVNTGSITGGAYGVYVVGGVVDANFTNTTADPLNLPPGVISGESGAGLVLAATDSWTGDITNDGTISGAFGAVVGGVPIFGEGTFVSSTEGDFDGTITNNGVIDGDFVGLTVTGVNVASNLINTGLIEGGSNGLVVEVGTWTGDITNTATGVIRGIDTGALISANVFDGDIVNDGLIEGAGLATGLHIVTDTHTGNIVNNGELSALSNALHVEISSELEGSITNTGLIEATGGSVAVRLEVNNGATFVNTAGGTILGDVIFGGKAPYDFIAEDGGIEGSLLGQVGGFGGEGGEGGLNDDVVTVQNGTHYFVFRGKSGTANNFASFDVEDGGVAVMGARFVGDTAGTGYGFNNVDALNVNDGGQLYIDKSTQLDVGAYEQEAGGTTTFFLAAPADGGEFALAATAATPGVHYGQIIASGPVDLSGTIAAVLDPLSFAGTGLTEIEYDNVIVGTALNGDFSDDQIFGDSYFFTLNHVLDGNTVDLRLSRTGFNNIPCLNANNDSFGNALETIFNAGGPINENLFQYLAGLSESDVCSAYDDIGGTVLADLGAVVVETAGPWKNMVNDRLNGIGSGSCGLAGPGWCFNRFAANEVGAGQVMTDATPGDDPFSWLRTGVRRVGETAAWGRLIGVWGDTSGSGGVAGTDFQITGAIAGVDHVFTPVLLAGVAAQWTSNEIDFDGRPDSADVDSFEAGAYVSYGDTRFYVNANASYIWHDFGVHRAVLGQAAIGEYDGTTLSAYVEAGKIFEAGNWRIQPLVALSYAHLETDDYSEFGTAIELLNVKGTEFDTLKGMVGARLAYPIEMKSGRKIVPEARLVWAHEFMDDHSTFVASLQSAPNVPFIVKGQEYSRDSVIVGAGLTAPISDSTSLFVDYDAGINPDITTHTVSVGFRMRW